MRKIIREHANRRRLLFSFVMMSIEMCVCKINIIRHVVISGFWGLCSNNWLIGFRAKLPKWQTDAHMKRKGDEKSPILLAGYGNPTPQKWQPNICWAAQAGAKYTKARCVGGCVLKVAQYMCTYYVYCKHIGTQQCTHCFTSLVYMHCTSQAVWKLRHGKNMPAKSNIDADRKHTLPKSAERCVSK